MKRTIRIVLIGILLFLAGGYVSLCAMADEGRVFPNTFVNDVDVSGMTLDEAEEALQQDAAACQTASVFTVSLEEKEYTVDVRDVLKIRYPSAAEDIFWENEAGFWARGFWWLKAKCLGNRKHYPPQMKDSAMFHTAVAASGIFENDDLLKKPYRIKDGQLSFVVGEGGKEIDENGLKNAILAAAEEKDYGSVIECPLSPLSDSGTADVEQIYQEVHKEMKNATLDAANQYAIVESVTGVDFDKESVQEQMDHAQEGDPVTVDLVYTEPTVTTQDLEEHLFADGLAAYKTKISGTSNRVTNIKLAAKKCNGVILLSGEEFSFNDTVGEQTAAAGFKTASAIQYGKIIQAYGGGICQVSSTIFAAALFANLEIVERWNHDYVEKYIPAGMDAAVAWGALDFRMANNTDYPVRIDVSTSGGYVTVALWGTKTDDASVEVVTEDLDSSTADIRKMKTYRKVYNEDKSLVFSEEVGYSEYIR